MQWLKEKYQSLIRYVENENWDNDWFPCSPTGKDWVVWKMLVYSWSLQMSLTPSVKFLLLSHYCFRNCSPRTGWKNSKEMCRGGKTCLAAPFKPLRNGPTRLPHLMALGLGPQLGQWKSLSESRKVWLRVKRNATNEGWSQWGQTESPLRGEVPVSMCVPLLTHLTAPPKVLRLLLPWSCSRHCWKQPPQNNIATEFLRLCREGKD